MDIYVKIQIFCFAQIFSLVGINAKHSNKKFLVKYDYDLENEYPSEYGEYLSSIKQYKKDLKKLGYTPKRKIPKETTNFNKKELKLDETPSTSAVFPDFRSREFNENSIHSSLVSYPVSKEIMEVKETNIIAKPFSTTNPFKIKAKIKNTDVTDL